MSAVVRDVRPPLAVIRLLNPIMRFVLRTPLGRVVRPFALLEFSGRRSGRRYRVPVGWHEFNGEPVVLTRLRGVSTSLAVLGPLRTTAGAERR